MLTPPTQQQRDEAITRLRNILSDIAGEAGELADHHSATATDDDPDGCEIFLMQLELHSRLCRVFGDLVAFRKEVAEMRLEQAEYLAEIVQPERLGYGQLQLERM